MHLSGLHSHSKQPKMSTTCFCWFFWVSPCPPHPTTPIVSTRAPYIKSPAFRQARVLFMDTFARHGDVTPATWQQIARVNKVKANECVAMATRSQTEPAEWPTISAHLSAPKINPLCVHSQLWPAPVSALRSPVAYSKKENRGEENEVCVDAEAKVEKQKRGCVKGQRGREWARETGEGQTWAGGGGEKCVFFFLFFFFLLGWEAVKWSRGGLHLTFFDMWKSRRSPSSSIKHFGGERGLPNNHRIPDYGFNE